MPLPLKPNFAASSNHRGGCCRGQRCELAQMAFPGASAPWLGLDVLADIALCHLINTEVAAGMKQMLAMSLGVGCGCSMPDADKTDAEVEEFDQVAASDATPPVPRFHDSR